MRELGDRGHATRALSRRRSAPAGEDGERPGRAPVESPPRGASGPPSEPRTMSGFLRVAWLVMRKDLRVESRSREMLFTTLFFAVSCVLVFSVRSSCAAGQAVEGAAGGHSVDRDRVLGHAGARARLRAGAPSRRVAGADAGPGRPSSDLSRQVNRVAAAARRSVEAVVVVMVAFLFQAPLFQHGWLLLALLALGTIGFASVGTLFSAMLVRTRQPGRAVAGPAVPGDHPRAHHGRRAAPPPCVQPEPDLVMAQALDQGCCSSSTSVFLTLALWTFEPVMTE